MVKIYTVLYRARLKGFKVKNKFRKQCLNRLKFNNNITKIAKDKKICKALLQQIDNYKPRNILLYIPMNIEVNITPLINILRKRKNINVFVPYMIGETFKPVPYRLPLRRGNFNIKEPQNSYVDVKIDMAIVPIVGIDKLNKRIGFGKGMYDRYYAKLQKKPFTVFTQRVLCRSKEILSDQYDIKADLIITT